ncbi:MAG: DUF790 family protein [Pirellulaceae bacterium]
MLTRRCAVATYDWSTAAVFPDRLTQTRDRKYRHLAELLLQLYRRGRGRTREQLHRRVRQILDHDPGCPPRRAEAFCKLLDDASKFDRIAQQAAPALRRQVFALAARSHPLAGLDDSAAAGLASSVRQSIARKLGFSAWHEMALRMYADVRERHVLKTFRPEYRTADELLSHYNVAQVQAALFDAELVTVRTSDDLKSLIRAVKLAHLMHRIEREASGRYRVDIDGPASILRRTSRYGAALARIIPTLARCRDWQLSARLRIGRRRSTMQLRLSSDDRLGHSLPTHPEYDSKLESQFAEQWRSRDSRYRLLREADVLTRGQSVFIPDYSAVREDGKRVLLEIVGFWTEDYLRSKSVVMQRFREEPIVWIVRRSNRWVVPSDFSWPVIEFERQIPIDQVFDAVEKLVDA